MMVSTNGSGDVIHSPLVTVVIATYNYAKFLPQAVCSVQRQTLENWECVIVDDASSDNTADVVADMIRKEPRIRYIRNSANLGEARTRNVGIAAARGRWIASLDADDWWRADKLSLQIDAMALNPGSVIGFSSVTTVSGDKWRAYAPDIGWLCDLDQGLRMDCQITHSSVIVSREALSRVGVYDTRLPYAVDWDLWLRLLNAYGRGAFVYVDEALVFYRWHQSNMSHGRHQNQQGERAVIRRTLQRDYWGLRHPIAAGRVLQRQAEREMIRSERAGDNWGAFLCGAAWAGLSPLRPSRWRYMLNTLTGVHGRQPAANT
jgi:glycosyltransferase involved in cell wall biosynthesis